VQLLGMPHFALVAPVTFLYTLGIAFLMVSRLPVFSGKRIGKRVSPELVLPVFVIIVLFFALLISYPWAVLTIGTIMYLVSLPLGWWSYREIKRKVEAQSAAQGAGAAASGQTTAAAGTVAAQPPLAPGPPANYERPTRLN
jgi:CDP-diacylglycerol---serine O-phosphatidyltransferase